MIKINLMIPFTQSATAENPSSAASYSSSGGGETGDTKAFLKNIFVMMLGAIALFAYENYNIPILQGQLHTIQTQLQEATTFNQKTAALKNEIKKYEEDLQRINTQMAFLDKVQKERVQSSDLIISMKDVVIPQVWIKTINARESGGITIIGEAETSKDINEFNAKLANTSYLKDVVTTFSEASTYKPNNIDTKYSIQRFEIKANYADVKVNTVYNGANP